MSAGEFVLYFGAITGFSGFVNNIMSSLAILRGAANGAGKTTLVKLLCGMYEPDEGRILINGIDRNDFPKEEWYRLFSIVFQETLILPFTVGENLAMDRAERMDEGQAWKAQEQAELKQAFRERGIHRRS